MEPEPTVEQDKAEAREARRQRILEKSNARLVKITGREHNEGNIFFSKVQIKLCK